MGFYRSKKIAVEEETYYASSSGYFDGTSNNKSYKCTLKIKNPKIRKYNSLKYTISFPSLSSLIVNSKSYTVQGVDANGTTQTIVTGTASITNNTIGISNYNYGEITIQAVLTTKSYSSQYATTAGMSITATLIP